ncbi:hypothetical protein HH303_10200 [Rhodospirillaceae bacterium KN72]|uniref:Uncharacterized protein n=1 Tax=Pacificispira spongiicola TaxID=2729598 RepID=A0A7Y0E080_9PROT|nr:SiaB family protein kinase [Pacificispira spongiicola]NMM44848.1 hypothetical protein [Pacificispira spongiicola]
MNAHDVKALRDILERSHIILSFNGPLTQSVIEELGDAIRRHLEGDSQQSRHNADLFSVYIELTQNIRNYAAQRAQDAEDTRRLNSGTVLVALEGDSYAIHSGNLIHRDDAAALSARLDDILALDRPGLKAAYKERLKNPIEDGAMGAGLGFLQIARTSSRPIEYDLSDADGDYVFFSLTVHL